MIYKFQKRIVHILGVSLIITLFSCRQTTINPFGAESIYYPPINILEDGIVFKYHVHSTNRQNLKTTNIQYTQWKYENDTLYESIFNAGFEPQYTRKILIEKGTSKLMEEKFHSSFYGITTATISDDSYINWNDHSVNSLLTREYVFDESTNILHRNQVGLRDTIIHDRKSKIIEFSGKIIRNRPAEIDTNAFEISVIYMANMGYYSNRQRTDNYNSTMELVEQISLYDFEKLQKNKPERVGFIDTLSAKKVDPAFVVCSDHEYIYDYYNGDPDGHLEGRKGEKWKVVNQLVDEEIIKGESGLLSIRFIINCEGEIDYFTSEQSDLDYKEYNFRKETVEHFIDITKSMKPWIPAVIRGEKVNSYAYIIYKIRNGKVIEILP